MLDTSDNIIAMMMPIIAENFKSLKTLNLLTRSSKSLRVSIYGDEALVRDITKRMSLMSRIDVRKLFLLTASTFVPFAAVQEKPFYPWSRVFPKCSAFDAFKISMEVHENIPALTLAFERRQVRSKAMKIVWTAKSNRAAEAYKQRREEIAQIRLDLFMEPQHGHFHTHSEIHYEMYGTFRPLNSVYRDKKLMMIHKKPTPTDEDIKVVELYKREMHEPTNLSHGEKLSILACNIGFEHWLANFTPHRELCHSVTRISGIAHPIDFLFQLPDVWPWIENVSACNIGEFQYDQIPVLYQQWRTEHDTLYANPVRNLD
jgi:hypothetical protein